MVLSETGCTSKSHGGSSACERERGKKSEREREWVRDRERSIEEWRGNNVK